MLLTDAYGDVKFRLPTRLLVDFVTVAPTFVRYESLPRPMALKPRVSAEGFLVYDGAMPAGGLSDAIAFDFCEGC